MGILEDKIRKLLSLASSDFEEEARSAMLKAQELMAKHNISMEDVSAITVDPVEVFDTYVDLGRKTIPVWHGSLANLIAKNFRCELYTKSEGYHNRKLKIFGDRKDVDACLPVIEFALLSMENCWKKYYASRKQTVGQASSRQITEMIKNDYMRGFISGVREAFDKQVKEKAIVLVKDALVVRYQNNLGLRAAPRNIKGSMGDAHASSSGYNDGRSIRGGSRITSGQRRITA